MNDELDRALSEALSNIGHQPMTLTVPAEALAALQPQPPKDDVDRLIDSAGQDWPVRVASYSEAI